MYPEDFDELHSVSDLHLGGEPGRQIFKGGDILAAFIRELAAKPAPRRVAFVINGDFVDFLAEPNAKAFDPDGARCKFLRIRNDSSFKDVFDALGQFIKSPGRRLIIVIGNHDIELSLPELQDALIESIAGKDTAARGRVMFSMDGCGFAARVGTKQVFCVHGNDVDSWNRTDYERLRRLTRDRTFGDQIESWIPNAGSKMVIEVMNEIKQRLPFVDLLKPETSAVVPILLALDKSHLRRLRGAASVAARLSWDRARKSFGLLSEDSEEPASGDPLNEIISDMKSKVESKSWNARRERQRADDLLRQADSYLNDETDPLDLIKDENGELGWGSAILDFIRRESKVEILREALESVQEDKSFDPTQSDTTASELDDLVSSSFDFVIAGHTHLERSLPRKNGSGRYLNTGTWARLIRIKPEHLKNEEAFQKTFEALQLPTIKDLDASPDIDLMHRATVASIEVGPRCVTGDIYHLSLDGGVVKKVLARDESN